VVLADPDEIKADLVCQDALGDDVADHLGVGVRGAVVGHGDVAEGVDAELKCAHGGLLPLEPSN